MSNKLNVTRNVFLEKEELNRLQEFILDSTSKFIFQNSTESFGIIANPDLSGDDFLVEAGTNVGTWKISNPSYGLDKDFNLIYTDGSVDNFPLPSNNQWYWIKVRFKDRRYEEGTVSVASDGTITGLDTEFQTVIRGQVTGKPTYVKFYKEEADGTAGTVVNDQVYLVQDVVNDVSMILSGDTFTPENGLKYVVVGAITLGTTLSTEQKQGLYFYNSCEFELVAESPNNSGDKPSGLATGEEFWLARIQYNTVSGTIEIEDKRDDYWRVNFGEILSTGFAEKDASNIGSTQAALWLTALGVGTYPGKTSSDFTDLDNLTAPQDAYIAPTTGISNLPTSTKGFLRVENSNTSPLMVIQRYITVPSTGKPRVFFRQKYSSTNWTEWKNLTYALPTVITDTTYSSLNDVPEGNFFVSTPLPTEVPEVSSGWLESYDRDTGTVFKRQNYLSTSGNYYYRLYNGSSWTSWQKNTDYATQTDTLTAESDKIVQPSNLIAQDVNSVTLENGWKNSSGTTDFFYTFNSIGQLVLIGSLQLTNTVTDDKFLTIPIPSHLSSRDIDIRRMLMVGSASLESWHLSIQTSGSNLNLFIKNYGDITTRPNTLVLKGLTFTLV